MRFDSLRIRDMGVFRGEREFDFTQAQGKLIALVGENGSGKSTALELLLGALTRRCPTRGTLASLATSRQSYVEVVVENGQRFTVRQLVDPVSGKGETVILDAEGRPVIESAKVRDADAWLARHFPPVEVLTTSIFAVQQSTGFLGLSVAERKSVLLDLLGVSRLEGLAEGAREHAREAKGRLETARARLADERDRGGDLAALEAELAEAREAAALADHELAAARAALEDGRARAAEAERFRQQAAEHEARRQELQEKLSSEQGTHDDLAQRLDNNRGLLQQGDEIRAAVATVAAAERAAQQATTEAERARESAERADADRSRHLADAEGAESRRQAAMERVERAKARLADRERIEQAVASVPQLRADLEAAERAVRVAEAVVAEVDLLIANHRTAAEWAEERAQQADADAAQQDELAEQAEGRRQAAMERVDRARARLADREKIRDAADALEATRAEIEGYERETRAAAARLEEIRGQRFAGAEERIGALRRALEEIGDSDDAVTDHAARLDAVAARARGALQHDDETVQRAAELPKHVREAEAALKAAQEAQEEGRRLLAEMEALAARSLEIDAAQADLEAAEKDEAAAGADRDRAKQAAKDARQRAGTEREAARAAAAEVQRLEPEKAERDARLSEAREAVETAQQSLADAEQLAARATDLATAADDLAAAEADEATAVQEAQTAREAVEAAERRAEEERQRASDAEAWREAFEAERERQAPLAGKAEHLARAEARIAELEPQLQAAVARKAELREQFAAIPTAEDAPPAPDVAALSTRVDEAEKAAREAGRRVALAEQGLEGARASAARVGELEAEQKALEEELADWTKLAADLGRDGLQALEIDAAGPELTELVNDLLHSCASRRWTVSIETTRVSADGKRQLEGCEVRVLDTERGREAEASTFSGGERVLLGEAVSLALTMLACRRSGLQGVTLVRDESGAALDAANARAYVAMLRRAAELVGASRVLFVSHDSEVIELADARIDVGGKAAA